MSNYSWAQIEQCLYRRDPGALMDIYINDTDRSDWEEWIRLMQENYNKHIVFETENGFISDRIAWPRVIDYWDASDKISLAAKIHLNEKVMLKCHFFEEDRIECDINPLEITGQNDHLQVMNYMKLISFGLNKPVFMSIDGMYEPLLIVDREDISYLIAPC